VCRADETDWDQVREGGIRHGRDLAKGESANSPPGAVL
jgi:hypothetical protein